MRSWSGASRNFRQILPVVVLAACTAPATTVVTGDPGQTAQSGMDQVLRGRQLVIQHGCGGCHGGGANPAAQGSGVFPGQNQWLAGSPRDTLPIGQFRAWPRNLTPDEETGLGRFSERQIFNALRYGLRPRAAPDVEITSAVPGQGNHPAAPNYLSPAMPWIAFRTMADADIRAIAAYLKRGLKPVSHRVQDSEAPADFWASEVTVQKIGTHVPSPFPTAHEQLGAPERREQVLRGRQLVIEHVCGLCHGGGQPDRDGWLAGLRDAPTIVAPYAIEFPIGPVPFRTRPRNLTPDNTTGIGRFTERQIFNALRFGLRPGETPDVEITSTTPGQGNFPANPKYLAPPMPWPEWRHMPDAELWAIAAYLKHGLKPVNNRVEDSEGPPDFWASAYTAENFGPYPAPSFPTANERVP
jgi:mono/diheme cytochrome c family protein